MIDFEKTAFIFPGQGSQIVGMVQDIAAEYPIVRETLDQADALMGFKLSDVMFAGPEDQLNDTKITQPAMYIAGVAILRALQSEWPDAQPTCVAGHSLGEFTALTAAGALTFEEGVPLVRERGRLMQEAGQQNPGSMAALLGISAPDAARLVADASAQTERILVIANDNCPGQIVISGDPVALDAAVALAKDYGARRAVPLAVSVATHSPLMQPAEAAFTGLVDAVNLQAPTIPVYANVDASPLLDIAAIRAELKAQLTSAVQWTQSTQAMIAAGIDTFVEIGPGNVLTGLLRRTDKSKTGINIPDLPALRAFIADNA